MLSATRLMLDAKIASGLDDFGNMDFAEGLHILANAINTEAGLTDDNEALFRQSLLRLLVNRLRMQRDVSRYPEILDEEVLPPVFITSLPRTGSTKLHRMLAASQDFNAMLFWQALNFARIDDATSVGPDQRLAPAREYLEWVRRRSPRAHAVHPMYFDEAEEETFLLDSGFNSLYWHVAYLDVPSYIEWVLRLDPHDAFEDIRRILQYMQWQHFRGQRRRWILKSPATLGREAVFADVFKGTDFIVTHRHPEKVAASGCATFSGIRELYNERDYSSVAAEHVLYSFGETIQGHLQWRAQHPADKVLDVRFDDIVSDEMTLLPQIYKFLDMPFTESSQRNVKAWLEHDARRGHAPAKFSLAEFGVAADEVNARFAAYINRYERFL